jgi:hypothetical protein
MAVTPPALPELAKAPASPNPESDHTIPYCIVNESLRISLYTTSTCRAGKCSQTCLTSKPRTPVVAGFFYGYPQIITPSPSPSS